MKYIFAIALTLFANVAFADTIIGNPVIANNPEEECLALNIYYEARSDNLAGKYAVADVVLNRVKDKRYPNTICGVVRQGRLGDTSGEVLRNRCQFSWYCDGKPDLPAEEDSWQKAQLVAYNIINHQRFRGITEGATHYHADYVNPIWAATLEVVGTIGQHIFYRWDL